MAEAPKRSEYNVGDIATDDKGNSFIYLQDGWHAQPKQPAQAPVIQPGAAVVPGTRPGEQVIFEPGMLEEDQQEAARRLGVQPPAPRPGGITQPGVPPAFVQQPPSPEEQRMMKPSPIVAGQPPAPMLGRAPVQAPAQAPVEEPTRLTSATSLASAPAEIKATAVDYWRKQGFDKLATLIEYAVPESWSGIAAMATTMIPGYGQLSLLGKVLQPAVVAGLTGLASGEGAVGGAVTGAATGLGARVGEKVVSGVTGVGKRVVSYGHQLFQQFSERMGPQLASVVNQAMPFLKQAGITVSDTAGVRSLFEEQARKKVGSALFDRVEDEIVKQASGGKIAIPVPRQAAQITTTTKPGIRRTATETTTGKAVKQTEVADDITRAVEKLSEAGEVPQVTRTVTTGKQARTTAPGKTARETVTATAPSTRETVSSRLAPSPVSQDVVIARVDPKQAILYLKTLRARADKSTDPAARDLYRTAEDLMFKSIKSTELLGQYKQARANYAQFMDFKRSMENEIGKVFPKVPRGGKPSEAGQGLDPLELSKTIAAKPELLDEARFGPLVQRFTGTAKTTRYPVGFYTSPYGGPVGFSLGKRPVPAVELPPHLQEAIARFPALGRLLQRGELPPQFSEAAAKIPGLKEALRAGKLPIEAAPGRLVGARAGGYIPDIFQSRE